MENIIEEGEIKGAIDPVTLQQTKTILEQMEKSVCRITTDYKNGTGFFCNIEANKEKIPVLITNYHIISDEYLDSEQRIKIYLNNKCIPIKLNKDRKVYSSSNGIYDIMILKINDIDNIQNINFLELDSNLLEPNSELAYEDSSIYILHYPSSNVKVSYGYGIKEKDKSNIIHKCQTSKGSSGSPILNLLTNKVIGIHKSFSKNTNEDNKEECYNFGTLLKYPLIEMNKNNNLKKNEQNLKIYFKKMYGRYENPDKLKNIEPKQINENKKMDRKISNLDSKLQTLKIENKIGEIKEKQEKEHIISFNQKMINIDNNYNNYEHEINAKEKEKMSEMEKHMNEIEDFRNTFNLFGEKFSNEKIFDVLKENDFDFVRSFPYFFDY